MKSFILRLAVVAMAMIVAFLLILDTTCLIVAYGEGFEYKDCYQFEVPADAAEYPETSCGLKVVTADRLNVRTWPDTHAERITYLEKGEHVYIVLIRGDWVLVRRAYCGATDPIGWVYSGYLY